MILRYRLSEDGIVLRYGGDDIVDLKEVDWVEISDHEARTVRVAIDRKTHLPIRTDVTTRDPKTNEKHRDGPLLLQLPSHRRHSDALPESPLPQQRAGPRRFFFESCQYNTESPARLFHARRSRRPLGRTPQEEKK